MKSKVLLLCFLSILSQVQGSTSEFSEHEDETSPYSVAAITRCDAIDPEFSRKRKYLWTLKEDLANLRKSDWEFARNERIISDFWARISSGNLREAETLRNNHGLYIDYTHPRTVSHVSALLESQNTSYLVLDYLYDNFPEIFHHTHSTNIFIKAEQKYLTHFYENYSGDSDLMHRLLEACCMNPALRLPDNFFRVSDPNLALENISIVKSFDQTDPELLKKCYELPVSLDGRFESGETVLTDAIKNSGNSDIINCILDRPESHSLVRDIDPSGKSPLKLVHESGFLPKTKAKLAYKIEGIMREMD